MSDDATARPPVARPDLIEYWFDLDAKDLLSNTAQRGQTFPVEQYPFGQPRVARQRGIGDDPRVERSAGWVGGGIDGPGW